MTGWVAAAVLSVLLAAALTGLVVSVRRHRTARRQLQCRIDDLQVELRRAHEDGETAAAVVLSTLEAERRGRHAVAQRDSDRELAAFGLRRRPRELEPVQ